MQHKHRYGSVAWNNTQTLRSGRVTVAYPGDGEEGKPGLRLHDGTTPGGWEVLSSGRLITPTPGPNVLQAGDASLGFYGEVPAADLVDGTTLASLVGLIAGDVMNNASPWLKVSYQNTVLMVAKFVLRHSLSWAALYNAGIVYGSDDLGVTPLDGGVTQDTRVLLKGNTYRVRLMKLFDTDPVSNEVLGGDWTAIFNALFNDWQLYTTAELSEGGADTGNANWVQETPASDAGSRYITTSGNFDTHNLKPTTYSKHYSGWRPVLELVGPAA